MQANTSTFCNAKVSTCKHGTSASTYKELKEFRSTNNVEHQFWLCPENIKQCMSDNKKIYVLNWPIVSSTWLVKIGTNLSREEVLALKDTAF